MCHVQYREGYPESIVNTVHVYYYITDMVIIQTNQNQLVKLTYPVVGMEISSPKTQTY